MSGKVSKKSTFTNQQSQYRRGFKMLRCFIIVSLAFVISVVFHSQLSAQSTLPFDGMRFEKMTLWHPIVANRVTNLVKMTLMGELFKRGARVAQGEPVFEGQVTVDKGFWTNNVREITVTIYSEGLSLSSSQSVKVGSEETVASAVKVLVDAVVKDFEAQWRRNQKK